MNCSGKFIWGYSFGGKGVYSFYISEGYNCSKRFLVVVVEIIQRMIREIKRL